MGGVQPSLRNTDSRQYSSAFPLVGKLRQVSFDHQKMAEFDSRIEKAALVIKQKAITRAGAAETSSQIQIQIPKSKPDEENEEEK